jgi:hypothetical protein
MQPQQTGVPFIIMQQVQPAFIIVAMQSQQAWIISQHLASPLVQVMTQPSAVISHLHMPMVRLQQQTIMPFIIMQQLHMPPASIVHRFCIMLQAILSVQEQLTFMPPVHFSNFMVQRGTIIMFMPVGMPAGIPVAPVPPIIPVIMAARSIIIVPVIVASLSSSAVGRSHARKPCAGSWYPPPSSTTIATLKTETTRIRPDSAPGQPLC